MKNIRKSTFREIKSSFGRFAAILSIIALGVGFFAGLKVTKTAMVTSMKDYLDRHSFYDYRLVSTLGFEAQDVEALENKEDVEAVEAALAMDVLYVTDSGRRGAVKTLSLPSGVNTVELVAGRLPADSGECVADSRMFDESAIGSTITISAENEQELRDSFVKETYTVVGLVQSPLYIQFERGNTSLGTGRLDGFVYLLPEAYDMEFYTDIYVRFRQDNELYGEGYTAYMDARQETWEKLTEQVADRRYQEILTEARDKLSEARQELADERSRGEQELADREQELTLAEAELDEKIQQLRAIPAEYRQDSAAAEEELEKAQEELEEGVRQLREAQAEFGQQMDDAEAELAEKEKEIEELEKPETYVLGRNTNVGYVCFENDSDIVEGIANVFPVFFFLVAALVCVTTMNRMVEEQRTQIGVLKALGYGNGIIMSKYMIYSGLAAVIGCVLGFFLGTWGFPRVIWYVYGIMYTTDSLVYVFDWKLAVLSVLVSMLCSVGATWFSCRVELSEASAQLMRPKAPKAGKRVILERIPFLWKRLSFLQKVSVRNIFRYKKRFFMMLVGISGCTALLVTGFGIKDSIADVAEKQFEEIQIYDIGVSFKKPVDVDLEKKLEELSGAGLADFLCVVESSMDIVTEKGTKSVYVVTGDRERMAGYVDMHTEDGVRIPFPGQGEGVITQKLAGQYGIKPGDTITLRDEEMRQMTVTVTAVMENYVNNYVYLSRETLQTAFQSNPEQKTAYVNIREDCDPHLLAAALMELEETASVTVNRDTVERVGSMMSSLNMIVVIVTLCAGVLAFIVLYNLTNINITERIREIATIKVLGFYKRETESYVFRENLLLTVLGMLPGLVLGHFLHAFVMSQVQIDLMAFDIRVAPVSYLYSALLTVTFAWLVNRGMSGRLDSVSMTESLKSVD
ncbi:MAG: FtsX-like permease family protein [Acetatifactor sp.]